MKPYAVLTALALTAAAQGCAGGSPPVQQYAGRGEDSGDSRIDGGDAQSGSPDSSSASTDAAPSGDGAGDSGSRSDGSSTDTGSMNDGGPGLDSAMGSETGSDGGGDSSASGLDPGLVLPDPSGAPCADPGQTQCSGVAEICRISSTTGGTCESCTGCGNLHALCTTDADCDTLFQCYEGYCDPLCQLTTPQTCGVPTDCINVGNATTGVCRYP